MSHHEGNGLNLAYETARIHHEIHSQGVNLILAFEPRSSSCCNRAAGDDRRPLIAMPSADCVCYFIFRGFKSSATAELMLKRARRQRKLQAQATRRKKLAGELRSNVWLSVWI